jgi:hypothetical protein
LSHIVSAFPLLYQLASVRDPGVTGSIAPVVTAIKGKGAKLVNLVLKSSYSHIPVSQEHSWMV